MMIRFGPSGPPLLPVEKLRRLGSEHHQQRVLITRARQTKVPAASMLRHSAAPIRTRSLALISEHRVVASTSGSCVLQGCLSCMYKYTIDSSSRRCLSTFAHVRPSPAARATSSPGTFPSRAAPSARSNGDRTIGSCSAEIVAGATNQSRQPRRRRPSRSRRPLHSRALLRQLLPRPFASSSKQPRRRRRFTWLQRPSCGADLGGSQGRHLKSCPVCLSQLSFTSHDSVRSTLFLFSCTHVCFCLLP